MPKITFEEEKCKGCSLCKVVCPKKIIIESQKLNAKGYHPMAVTDMDECIGCAMCATMCPDVVIKIEK